MTTPDGSEPLWEDANSRIDRLQSEMERLLDENRRLRETADALRQASRSLSRTKLGGAG